jgi:hypothetical protein
MKRIVIQIEPVQRRNRFLLAMYARHKRSAVKMKDRRTQRGGSRDKQKEYLEE